MHHRAVERSTGTLLVEPILLPGHWENFWPQSLLQANDILSRPQKVLPFGTRIKELFPERSGAIDDTVFELSVVLTLQLVQLSKLLRSAIYFIL